MNHLWVNPDDVHMVKNYKLPKLMIKSVAIVNVQPHTCSQVHTQCTSAVLLLLSLVMISTIYRDGTLLAYFMDTFNSLKYRKYSCIVTCLKLQLQ